MAIPADWRGRDEPAGAFVVELVKTLTTTWEALDVRSAGFLARADVAAQLAAAGVTGAQAQATAVIRVFDLQNRDNADPVEYSLHATAGGQAAPTPADAYLVAVANNGTISRRYGTRDEVSAVLIRAGANTAPVNIALRFDVPR